MKILGVDPGIKGGCAIVMVHDGAAPDVVDIIEIPVVGVGAKERRRPRNPHLDSRSPDPARIYRTRAMPKQGASSGFKYGRATGAIEAVLTCCEIPMTIIEPTAWKKFRQFRGGDKEAGRQRALQLFPSAHALLARNGEAALIALYGANLITPVGAQHAA